MIKTVKTLGNQVVSHLPEDLKNNAFLNIFSLSKIPLLFFCRPKVVQLTDEDCQVLIPLSRRTKNHLNAMYFGALAVGADTAGGLAAMREIMESGEKVSLVFKDFKAEFLKRAEGDVLFTNKQVKEVRALVHKTIETKEREEFTFEVEASCPKISDEPVARFHLTLSLKAR
tara:strand:+ start:56386 stop:56898 length:513 start_codon:yes stop_codon:yes gene_type:complete